MEIVQTLRDYGEVPVDFLADKIGENHDETMIALKELEDKGVVSLKDDHVVLAQRSAAAG